MYVKSKNYIYCHYFYYFYFSSFSVFPVKGHNKKSEDFIRTWPIDFQDHLDLKSAFWDFFRTND